MQLCEISFQTGIDSKTRSDLQRLAETATTIEELLAGWPLITTESISFEPGIDDEHPDLPLLAVSFKRDNTLLARVYYTKEAPSKLNTPIVPIDKLKIGFRPRGEILMNESLWDKLHDDLGFVDSYALCSKIGPHSALLPYLLCYVQSDGGSVYLSRSEHYTRPDDYEDEIAELLEEGIAPDQLLTMHLSYHNPTPVGGVIPGFGSSVYVRLS